MFLCILKQLVLLIVAVTVVIVVFNDDNYVKSMLQPHELMFVDVRDDSDYDSGISSNNIYINDSK